MSSSVTVAPRMLLFRSPQPTSPRSPHSPTPLQADGPSIHEPRTSQVERSISSLSSTEMDLASSVSLLPSSAIPVQDQDSQMVDADDVSQVSQSTETASQTDPAEMSSQADVEVWNNGQEQHVSSVSVSAPEQVQRPVLQPATDPIGSQSQSATAEQSLSPAEPGQADSDMLNGFVNGSGDSMDATEGEGFTTPDLISGHIMAEGEPSTGPQMAPSGIQREDGPQTPPSLLIPATSPQPPGERPSEGENSAEAADYPYSETSSDTELETPTTRPNYVEDTSTPDEEELKEIESRGERTAMDYGFFESEAFPDLDDPEHEPGASGRIHWTISNFRGSPEHPNTETVMRSPSVRIGDLDWNLQVYPNGNNTDYVSVYLEASNPRRWNDRSVDESVSSAPEDKNTSSSRQQRNQSDGAQPAPASGGASSTNAVSSVGQSESSESPDQQMQIEAVEKPATQQENKAETSRWGTAAQFSVVMYNPDEPRVYVSHKMQHRFCNHSPDWGWTRFHGPQHQLHERQRGQRQAMLRNDTLAFTAFVRVVKDDTQRLWEHWPASQSTRYDSYYKTGLRPMSAGRIAKSFLVAAISSWVLLAPFREVVFGIPTKIPPTTLGYAPKGLVKGLQRVIQRLQTPARLPISLRLMCNFLITRGVNMGSSYDVVEFWEIIRRKLEDELRGTEMEGKLGELFDGSIQRRPTRRGEDAERETIESPLCAGKPPSFRLPIKGVESIQAAIARSLDGDEDRGRAIVRKAPKFLQLELGRREFEESSRTWRRLVDSVKYDEKIDLTTWTDDETAETHYTLYGLIVHEGDLHTDRYHPVLRPGGPGTRWYAYIEEDGIDKVICQTYKQAVLSNQGVALGEKAKGTEPVAYVVMYVRDDVLPEVLQGVPKEFKAPEWAKEQTIDDAGREGYTDIQIFPAGMFTDRTERGVHDIYMESDATRAPDHVIRMSLLSTMTFGEVQQKLADILQEVDFPAQCQLWRLDTLQGPAARTHERVYWAKTLAEEKKQWPHMQFWLYIVPWNGESGSTSSGSPVSPVANIETEMVDSQPAAHPEQSQSFVDDGIDTEPEVSATIHQEVEGEAINSEAAEDTRMTDVSSTTSSRATENNATSHDHSEMATGETLTTTTATENSTSSMEHDSGAQEPTRDLSQSQQLPDTQETGQSQTQGNSSVYYERPYIFVKRFDVKKQVLEGMGSYLARAEHGIVASLRDVLEIPEGQEIEVTVEWAGQPKDGVGRIGSTITFGEAKPVDGEILIVDDVLSDEQKDEVEKDGGFVNGQAYLEYLKRQDYSSLPTDGFVTRDYFPGDFYSGHVHHGLFHGQGTHISTQGDSYTGTFAAGKRRGHGRMRFQNGDEYVGDWRDDVMHGQGKLVYAKTGNTYVGGFRAGRRHGRGRMEYLVAEDEQHLCQICYEAEVDSLFYDCGHVCACFGCAAQLQDCPLCRKTVVKLVKMYRS